MDNIIESWSKFDQSTWSAIWLLTIIFVIMAIICVACNIALRKHIVGTKPNKFVMFIMYFAGGMRNTIDENLGKRFRFLGPYLMFVMTFYLTAIFLGFFGLPVAITYLSVPLSLALLMLVMNWTFAIKDYGLSFFKKFINPLALSGEIAPVISMTFRIFGNILAGSIILTLINTMLGTLQNSLLPFIEDMNILGPIIQAPLRMYFDVFAGLVQAYIFMLLTVIYIGLAVKPEEEMIDEVAAKLEKKLKKSTQKRGDKQELQKALQS